jgi:hypothetical protein
MRMAAMIVTAIVLAKLALPLGVERLWNVPTVWRADKLRCCVMNNGLIAAERLRERDTGALMVV